MKQLIRTTVFCLFISLAITACKEEDEKYPTHEPPVWNVDFSAGYYESMTAVVALPSNLAQYANENDQLAAFASDGTCRGVGVLNSGAYFVSIKGTPDDQSGIRFKYYSASNRYLYQTEDLFAYDTNLRYGTADEPRELKLEVIK